MQNLRVLMVLCCILVIGGMDNVYGQKAGKLGEVFEPPPGTISLADVKLTQEADTKALRIRFEDVPVHHETVFRIPVFNALPNELKIKDVKLSCGCLGAIPASSQLPVEKTTDLFVVFTPTKAGATKRPFTLFFEGPNEPVTIELVGKVKSLHELEAIVHVSAKDTSAELKVKNNFDTGVTEVSDIVIQSRFIKDTQIAWDEEGSTATVTLLFSEQFGASPSLYLPLSVCVVDAEKNAHEYRCVLRKKDVVRFHPQTLVERKQSNGTLSASAFIDGDSELLEALAKSGELQCQMPGDDGNIEILSTRMIGDSLLVAEVKVEPGERTAHDRVTAIWKRKSDGAVLGETKILLSRL